MKNNLLIYFPNKIAIELQKHLDDNLEEIRIRCNNNITLKYNSYEKILNINPNNEDILQIVQNICDNSIYAYQNEICEGFITVKGGNRIGITRKCSIRRW